eukprot:CAMPEP_0206042792 /NCGR_PEP_ID=MMETSP1466-20131121/6769_1 /ASSEMBLY_ACC=CAM_ASM_001126 /TAXON_ID=44452 /ORGANISM="Pavlova gyrans, Strain CCMP608" /LENGTH=438 /DNA_ID=CAMNT_0053417513 /DNA_START=19 /DNA_END=1334 /DNA_ORIENTATION=-
MARHADERISPDTSPTRVRRTDRRGSADALSVPSEAGAVPRSASRRQASSAAAGGRHNPSDDGGAPEALTHRGSQEDAPPSNRSAPAPGAPPGPFSPDMSNLSPLHAPSRQQQLIQIPPMPPLPDAAAPPPFDDIALSPTGREAAEVLSTLTGGKRALQLHEASAARHAGVDEDDDQDEDAAGKKQRGSRCGTCANCLRPDCGTCTNCLDKPKFGGPGVKKQACTGRKCLNPNLRGPQGRQPVSLFRPKDDGGHEAERASGGTDWRGVGMSRGVERDACVGVGAWAAAAKALPGGLRARQKRARRPELRGPLWAAGGARGRPGLCACAVDLNGAAAVRVCEGWEHARGVPGRPLRMCACVHTACARAPLRAAAAARDIVWIPRYPAAEAMRGAHACPRQLARGVCPGGLAACGGPARSPAGRSLNAVLKRNMKCAKRP